MGGFDPPPPARIRPEMLPLHYNDSGVCAPPSHISVIVFTMSKLIQMIFYQVNQWCPLASNGFIIITINRLNDFLPKGIHYHFSDMCPPQSFARLFLRTYPSQTSLCCLNVIGWFRSTSPDADVASTLPLRYNDSV